MKLDKFSGFEKIAGMLIAVLVWISLEMNNSIKDNRDSVLELQMHLSEFTYAPRFTRDNFDREITNHINPIILQLNRNSDKIKSNAETLRLMNLKVIEHDYKLGYETATH